MCVVMSVCWTVGVSSGSREQDLKSASEQYHGAQKDDKLI